MNREFRKVGNNEFEVTEQVWYDAYMMSIPEFVNFYQVTNQFKDTQQCGTDLRALFFELRDRLGTEKKSFLEGMKKSQLRIWLAERNLTLKQIAGDAPFPKKQKEREISSLDEANEFVEKGMKYASDHRPTETDQPHMPLNKKVDVHKLNPDLIEETIEKPIQKKVKMQQIQESGESRLDQVKYWLNQGITSPTEIAKKIGANPSYVQRLKKQAQESE